MLLLICLAMINAINAAALGLRPIERGKLAFVQIECNGPLPRALPPELQPPFTDLQDMCAGPNRNNMGCHCDGPEMSCGLSNILRVQRLITTCFRWCTCGDKTKKNLEKHSKDLDSAIFDTIPEMLPMTSPFAIAQENLCKKSCTGVKSQCSASRRCICAVAQKFGLFHWTGAKCVHHSFVIGKRQVRSSSNVDQSPNFSINARQNQKSLPIDEPAYNMPAPCNESYVSYACHDSIDGIVHEPLQNWLGALLPENAKEAPPVPKRWLQIHGFEE